MLVSLKTLQDEVKVSRQAISAVLNNKSNCRVSPSTREKILNAAYKMGYQTNFGYQVMRGNETPTIAVILASERRRHSEFSQNLLLMLIEHFNAEKYEVYSCMNMTSDPEENLQTVRRLIMRGVSHFLFIGTPFGEQKILEELTAQKKSYVGLQSLFPHNIDVDVTAAEVKLISSFRSRIGEDYALFMSSLYPEYLQALRLCYPDSSEAELISRYVIRLKPLEWKESSFSDRMFEQGYESAARISAERPGLRGLIYLEDSFALGAASYFHTCGRSVGKEILLAGLHNERAVRHSLVPISSIEFPLEEICHVIEREVFSLGSGVEHVQPVVHFREFSADTGHIAEQKL